MALIPGLHIRKPNPLTRPKSSTPNSRHKWKSGPVKNANSYNESTTVVGEFVLHEQQVVSPESMKSASNGTNSPVKENERRSKKSEISNSELLAPVESKKRRRAKKTDSPVIDERQRQDSPTTFPEVSEDAFNSNIFQAFNATPQPQELEYDTSPLVWTPLQRLFQLNQALSITDHYKDEDYWERIFLEFFETDARIRLYLGDERSFSFPPFVMAKLFWVWSQLGLESLQFAWARLDESMNEDGSISAASYTCSMNSYHLMRSAHISQTCQMAIRFSFSSKIAEFNLSVTGHKAFGLPANNTLKFGFDDALVTFMDVASVMSAVLPEYSSWMTWFISYCQQHNYVNNSSLAAYAAQVRAQAQVNIQANDLSYSVDLPEMDPPPAIFGVELDDLPNEAIDQAHLSMSMDQPRSEIVQEPFADDFFESENEVHSIKTNDKDSEHSFAESEHILIESEQVEPENNANIVNIISDNKVPVPKAPEPIEDDGDDFFSSYMD